MRPWQAIVPEKDREIYENGGLGQPQSFGGRPALLIIDVVESFTGTRPADVLEAIGEYRTSCGQAAWNTLPNIKKLLEECRSRGVLVVYAKGDPNNKYFCGESTKRSETREETLRRHSTAIHPSVAPQSHEYVLHKTKASAFFGTPLVTYFNQQKVDSLLVCGTSTSGCVRATVVEGCSYGYAVFVVEDCCFDRSEFFHNVALFDMNAKYATVITLEEALEKLGKAGFRQSNRSE
ncbi:MAG: isochorismatase family protein [Chloroflexi bacterium]|nr:isochorismatase family protein [Chloroflexota bacterium]